MTMLKLKGKNLGERQKELNLKVNDAAANKIPFEQIKDDAEGSDIDRFFKIDLASQYKNIYYMLDVLKCGDSLYISRALKCLWMYEDEYDFVINVVYLHENIFPFMSNRMKRKTLTAIAGNIKNEDRAEAFYEYCMTAKLTNIAFKFLVATSDSYKLSVPKKQVAAEGTRYIKFVIGNSFVLAKAFLEALSVSKRDLLFELRNLYTISNEKYLELIESVKYLSEKRLGRRVSGDITKKYKERILNNIHTYFNVLNLDAVAKNSTREDVKLYLTKLIPKYLDMFWHMDFCNKYKSLIEVLPAKERFLYIKKIFADAYQNEEFEMSRQFYELNYHKIMTEEQREAWALKHLSTNSTILDKDEQYMWYRFINFKTAFADMNFHGMTEKYYSKRNEIFAIFISTVDKEEDVEMLLKYYYECIDKGNKLSTETFLDDIIKHHNVLGFNNSCWLAFENILYKVDAYNDSSTNASQVYKVIGLIYHIIDGDNLPDALKTNICFKLLKSHTSNLIPNQEEKVYSYMLQLYVDQLNNCEQEDDTSDSNIRNNVRNILQIMHHYSKSKEDCPEVAMKYVSANWDEYKNEDIFRKEAELFTQEHFIRDLKKDASIVTEKLPWLKKNIYTDAISKIGLNKFLNKLKIYFSEDIAKTYLDFFIEMLPTELHVKVINLIIDGIFILADESFIYKFMMKYDPEKELITFGHKDLTNLFYIRKSICRSLCRSRGPTLMYYHNFLKYSKDAYCMATFDTYISHLPVNIAGDFIKELLRRSLPLQRHGIRLALTCYNSEEIKNFVMDIWNDPGKESLRVTLYKALYNLVKRDKVENEVVHLLNAITYSLQQNDPEDIFELLTAAEGFSEYHIGDYLANAWLCVEKLIDDDKNVQRKINIIDAIRENIDHVPKHFVKSLVHEYVEIMLIEKQILIQCQNSTIEKLHANKWKLVAAYIVENDDEEVVEQNKILVKLIIHACIEMWNEIQNDVYIIRKFCFQFIDSLYRSNNYFSWGYHNVINEIFGVALKILEAKVPPQEIFLKLWFIRIIMVASKTLNDVLSKNDKEKSKCKIEKCIFEFGKEIGEVISKSYEGGLYGNLSGLTDEVINCVKRLYDVFKCDCGTQLEHVHVCFCAGLTETDILETYELAAMILPNDISGRHKELHLNIINKVQKVGHMPVQCYLYDKYVNTDFKKGEFMLDGEIVMKSKPKTWNTLRVMMVTFLAWFLLGLTVKYTPL